MKHLLQAIQLNNAAESIVQREIERPIVEKERELRRQRVEHDLADLPLTAENRRLRLQNEAMELKQKKAELLNKGILEGTIGAGDLDYAKKLHEAEAAAAGLSGVYGAVRNGSPDQVEASLKGLETEMESQGMTADERSVILGHVGDVQMAGLGPNGQRAVETSKLTPQRLVDATFWGLEKPDEEQAFQLEDSDRELVTGIVERAHEILGDMADDEGTPLQQKRTMAYSLAVLGSMGETNEESPTVSGRQMFIAKQAAQAYMTGLAYADSALMVRFDANIQKAQAEAVIESGVPEQFAGMSDAETYGMVTETVLDVDPDLHAAIYGSLLPTGRQFDEIDFVDRARGIDLNKAVLDGSVVPQSMLARQIVSKAVIREWQRRVIQRGGPGEGHAVQGLVLAYRRVANNDFPETGTAIGDVLADTYQKWANSAVVKHQESRIFTPAQQEIFNTNLAHGRIALFEAGNNTTPYTYLPAGHTPSAQAFGIRVAGAFESGDAFRVFPPNAMQQLLKGTESGVTAFDATTFFEAKSMNLSPGENDTLAQIDAFVSDQARTLGTRTLHGRRLNQMSRALKYIRNRGGERSFDPEHRRWAAGEAGFQIGTEAERFEKATGLPAARAAQVLPLIEELHTIGFQHDLAVATQGPTWRQDVDTLRKQYLLVNIDLYKAMDIDLRDVVAGPRSQEPVLKATGMTQAATAISQSQSQMPEPEEERPARVPKGVTRGTLPAYQSYNFGL